MTVWRLKHDEDTGDVAIYSVPSHASTDDSPLTDPLSNADRLQFHSGHIYPSTTPALTQEVDVTIPSQAANRQFSGTIVLFDHGFSDACMVEGYIVDLGGERVDLNGSVPVYTAISGFATWVALCSTSTQVILRYWGMTPAFSSARPATSFTVVVSAFDFLASGPAPTGDPDLPRVLVSPTRVQFGRGRFDSARRYIRRLATGTGIKPLATGPTVAIVGSGAGPVVQNITGWRWRYACAGFVAQTVYGWNTSTTSGGSYQAPFIRVTF